MHESADFLQRKFQVPVKQMENYVCHVNAAGFLFFLSTLVENDRKVIYIYITLLVDSQISMEQHTHTLSLFAHMNNLVVLYLYFVSSGQCL